MKKTIFSVLALLIMATLIVSPGMAQAKVVIKLGTGTPPTHPQDRGALFLADMVKQESKGEMEVQVHHSSALGGHRQLMEGMQLGTVQMYIGALAFVGPFWKPISVLELPFLFKDLKHTWAVKHGPIGQKLQAGFEKKTGVKLIAWGGGSFQGFYTHVRQIKTMADMKGLKMRVMSNPVRVAYMNAWGAKATPLPFAEFYSAMEQKVVDGGENSYATYAPAKHYEVAPFFTESNHVHMPSGIFIASAFYKKLTPEQKAVIDKACAAADKKQAEFWIGQQSVSKEEAVKAGSKVHVMTPEARAEFEKAVGPVYEKFAKELGGMELIQAIKDYKY